MLHSLSTLTDTLGSHGFPCALLRSVLSSCSAQLRRQLLSNPTHHLPARPRMLCWQVKGCSCAPNIQLLGGGDASSVVGKQLKEIFADVSCIQVFTTPAAADRAHAR